MTEILELVDLDELRKEVREKYREVAQDPTAEYHFHTGRAHALRLGYPPSPLDRLPEAACESFAGVGNPFFWAVRLPGTGLSTWDRARAWTHCGPAVGAGRPDV